MTVWGDETGVPSESLQVHDLVPPDVLKAQIILVFTLRQVGENPEQCTKPAASTENWTASVLGKNAPTTLKERFPQRDLCTLPNLSLLKEMYDSNRCATNAAL